jgi:hypothetical protein
MAPFVAESPIKVALQLMEVIPIHFNNTYFVIGAVTDIYMDPILLSSDGCLDLNKAGIMASLGINSYHPVGEGTKLAYAKP